MTKIDRMAIETLAVSFVVRYLTTNGRPNRYITHSPFALRYRRVNADPMSVVDFVLGVKLP